MTASGRLRIAESVDVLCGDCVVAADKDVVCGPPPDGAALLSPLPAGREAAATVAMRECGEAGNDSSKRTLAQTRGGSLGSTD